MEYIHGQTLDAYLSSKTIGIDKPATLTIAPVRRADQQRAGHNRYDGDQYSKAE